MWKQLLSRFKRTNESTKPSGSVQCWLTDEVTRFGGNIQERTDNRGGAEGCSRYSCARSAENGGRRREDRGDRGAGGGGCSSKPIATARPGVRRTLRSVSNNVNKRASILRFYRPALSIFNNAAGRAARGKTVPREAGRVGSTGREGGCWMRGTSGSKMNPNGGG